jgi:hypothetical protein
MCDLLEKAGISALNVLIFYFRKILSQLIINNLIINNLGSTTQYIREYMGGSAGDMWTRPACGLIMHHFLPPTCTVLYCRPI